MNLNKILDNISKATPEALEQKDGRREVLKNIGKTMAMAAVPVALNTFFSQKAKAQNTTITISEALMDMLNVEYLQYALYQTALNTSGFIPSAQNTAFQTILGQQQNHITYLKTTIQALGGTPQDMPIFDFTLNNTNNVYGNVWYDYQTTFLELANALEDAAVRFYKGILTYVRSNRDILTSVIRMQSTEARHAAHIRTLRNLTPWVNSNESGTYNKLLQPFYNGENQTSQMNILLVNINGANVTADEASQAFDEPLDINYFSQAYASFIAP
jgi:bacterioferritin (cytochrome b1)